MALTSRVLASSSAVECAGACQVQQTGGRCVFGRREPGGLSIKRQWSCGR